MEPKRIICLRKDDLRGNYERVKCPNGCGRLLLEASARRCDAMNIEIRCIGCEQKVLPSAFFQAEGESDVLIASYWCSGCASEYEKVFYGVRKKCSGCNKYQNIFAAGSSNSLNNCS